MDLECVSADKHARKELDQYPAILTSRLVNNSYKNGLPYLCKSLLSYTPDHVQAANQKEARGFAETATCSWKTELVPTDSSGWDGTNAACPKRLREKLSVPMLIIII